MLNQWETKGGKVSCPRFSSTNDALVYADPVTIFIHDNYSFNHNAIITLYRSDTAWQCRLCRT